MRYRNTETGAIIDSPFKISGDNWEEYKPEEAAEQNEETTDGYVDEEIDLEKMTKPELTKFAKEHEIEINKKDTKQVIIEAIVKAFEE